MKYLLYASLLLLLISSGCGMRRIHPEVPDGPRYEIAWIDPQIVLTDSLFTLIRAERIDSFYVDRPTGGTSTAPSVVFHIVDVNCFTSVNLLGPTGDVIKPLLAKNLRRGHYKLTVDWNRFPREHYPVISYSLRAEFCDSSVTQPINLQM
jgi:hypothetical protein